MQVRINSDNVTAIGEATIAASEERVRERLQRFAQRLTRVEVHLRDQDGSSARGEDGLEAMIEARPAGLQPVAVSHRAQHADEAITGALTKMTTRLETVFGKQSA